MDRAGGGGLRHLPDVERPPEHRLVQRSQRRLRLARRLGLHRAHPADGALHAAPDRRSTTSSPGPRRSCSARPARRWCRKSPQTIAWDTRDHAPQRDQGLAAAQHAWRSAAWAAREYYCRGDGRRRDTTSSIVEDFVASIGGSVGAIAPLSTTPRCASTTASSSAATRCAASRSAASARATPTRPTRWAASITTPARPNSASRSACPRRSASSARPSSMSARCGDRADDPSQVSTVLDSQLMRVSHRHRHPMDIAIRADPYRLCHPARLRNLRQDRELPLQLRHALLSGDGARMNMQTDKTSMATSTATSVDIKRILQMIPHRYPMLMVDRVIEMQLERERRRHQERQHQRAVLPGPFPVRAGDAGRADRRGDGADRRRAGGRDLRRRSPRASWSISCRSTACASAGRWCRATGSSCMSRRCRAAATSGSSPARRSSTARSRPKRPSPR